MSEQLEQIMESMLNYRNPQATLGLLRIMFPEIERGRRSDEEIRDLVIKKNKEIEDFLRGIEDTPENCRGMSMPLGRRYNSLSDVLKSGVYPCDECPFKNKLFVLREVALCPKTLLW